MKAYQMVSVGTSEFRDVPLPKAGPGEIVIAPEAVGVCGTDLHVLKDGVYVDPEHDLPVTMGHEVVGRVIECGPPPFSGHQRGEAGRRLQVGDRVVVEPVLNCGACLQCRQGYVNLCSDWVHLGFTVDGAWAERLRIPETRATKIAESVPREVAVLAEPLACSLHFLSLGELKQGQTILIIGGGPSGQLAVAAAKSMGASKIILSDPHQHRRDLALQMGADMALNPRTEEVPSACRKATDGQGVDIVLEIAGSESAIQDAITLPRPGGTVVLAGVCGQEETAVNTQYIVRSEITVRGGFATRWQMQNAVRLLEDPNIDFKPLVNLVHTFDDVAQAMEDTASRRDICKVVLTMN